MGRVGLEAAAASVAAGGVGVAILQVTGTWLGTAPGWFGLVAQVTVVGLGFGLVYAAISLALRIPELPTIVGVMVDALRRPGRA